MVGGCAVAQFFLVFGFWFFVFGFWFFARIDPLLSMLRRKLQFTSRRQEISLTASIISPFTQHQLNYPAKPSWHPLWRY